MRRRDPKVQSNGRSVDESTGGLPMPQKQIQKTSTATKKDQEDVEELPEVTLRGDDLKSGIDDLLDEIDEVLEENAEEFVKQYIQRGGE
jgi:prokaryotic ubiquitin-like protein Pup